MLDPTKPDNYGKTMDSLQVFELEQKGKSRFESILFNAKIRGTTQLIRTVKDLEHHLRTPGIHNGFIVLAVADRKTMAKIIEIGALFQDIKVMVIVPENDHAILSMAFDLLPRYIGFYEDEPVKLMEILARLRKLRRPITNKSSPAQVR